MACILIRKTDRPNTEKVDQQSAAGSRQPIACLIGHRRNRFQAYEAALGRHFEHNVLQSLISDVLCLNFHT